MIQLVLLNVLIFIDVYFRSPLLPYLLRRVPHSLPTGLISDLVLHCYNEDRDGHDSSNNIKIVSFS